METTCADSFELFYGLFRYNPHSHSQLRKLRESFAEVERQASLNGGRVEGFSIVSPLGRSTIDGRRTPF